MSSRDRYSRPTMRSLGSSFSTTSSSFSSAASTSSATTIGAPTWRRKVYGQQALSTMTNYSRPSTLTSDTDSRMRRSSTGPLTVTANGDSRKHSKDSDDIGFVTKSMQQQNSSTETVNEAEEEDVKLQRKSFVVLSTTTPTSPAPSSKGSNPEIQGIPSPPLSRRSESPSDRTETSFASAIGGELSKSTSFESLYTKSMATAVSGEDSLSIRSNTPTDTLEVESSQLRSIKSQLELMENRCAVLEKENSKLRCSTILDHLSLGVTGSGSLGKLPVNKDECIRELSNRLAISDSLCQDYRDENTSLKCELQEVQECITQLSTGEEVKKLREKISAAEGLCEELMDENEVLKRDIHDLQTEVEEMHDQYREEEIEEFRDLQRDLEQTAKNCRILQFKLRKAERQNEQTETDRQHLKEKLKELANNTGYSEQLLESPRIKEVESELRIAKEVSVRLHNELEHVEEKRCKIEDENFYLKERLREMEAREKLMEASRQNQKRTLSGSRGALNCITSSGRTDLPDETAASGVVSASRNQHHADVNSGQIARDLQDALERETDLREQLRFAEEDILAARKKFTDLETENDGLMKQLSKLTMAKNQAGNNRQQQMKRSLSEGHAQIELELAEHEAAAMKEKVNKLESEKLDLVSKIALLEREVKKLGGKTSFTEAEIHSALPDTYYKQKIRMLEEELEDLKLKLETMQKTEVDQDISRGYLGTGSGSGSVSSSGLAAKRAQRLQRTKTFEAEQIPDAEQDSGSLRQRCASLEEENQRLVEQTTRLQSQLRQQGVSRSGVADDDIRDYGISSQMQQRIAQMESDIHRFINRISELEKEKQTLNKELDRRKRLDSIKQEETTKAFDETMRKFNVKLATTQELRDKVEELLKENSTMTAGLKTEQQKCGEFETQLAEYKQLINQSENQRLVTMATRVEILTNQIKGYQDRLDSYHKRVVQKNGEEAKKCYETLLKERLDKLEQELAVEKAKSLENGDSPKTSLVEGNKRVVVNDEALRLNTSNLEKEIERALKAILEVENTAKNPPTGKTNGTATSKTSGVLSRYRPTSTSNSTASGCDSEQLCKSLGRLKPVMEAVRKECSLFTQTATTTTQENTDDFRVVETSSLGSAIVDQKLRDSEKTITELRQQLELAKSDRKSAQNQYNQATERLLQTEDRWNKELERLRESYETQVRNLSFHLQEAERLRDEKVALVTERTERLNEKIRRVVELEARSARLENELKSRHKDLESRLESERKRAGEFQTKYQKLEELYEAERAKTGQEKDRMKAELQETRKRTDEAQTQLEITRKAQEKLKLEASKEKQELDTQLRKLQAELSESEKKASARAQEMAGAENRKLLNEISDFRRQFEAQEEKARLAQQELQQKLDAAQKEVDKIEKELSKATKECQLSTERIAEQRTQLEDTRRSRDDAREELNRWQQTWSRERSELTHKLRQEEKIQQAELQALRMKYESRIRVMEDTNKRLGNQLSTARRERDQNRELMQTAERKLAEIRQNVDIEEKELRQKVQNLKKEAEEIEDLKVQLEQQKTECRTLRDCSETDKKLWQIEKQQFENQILKLSKDSNNGINNSEKEKGSNDSPVPATDGAAVIAKVIPTEKMLADALKVASDLRRQLDGLKANFDKEVNTLKKQLERTRLDAQKERTELQRKTKELQENVKILEIDRRNLVSGKDEAEKERTALTAEKDSLQQRLHDAEIHQLANKYKLDKIIDQLTDLHARIRYCDAGATDKREMADTVQKVLEQLQGIREELNNTKDLVKALELFSSGDKADRSPTSDPHHWLSVPGSADRVTRRTKLEELEHSRSLCEASCSIDSTTSYDLRIAELRLRSPSPSPRKVTVYPEAPPSIILSTRTAVEYDASGKRHWRNVSKMNRSPSCDVPFSSSTSISSPLSSSVTDASASPKPTHVRHASLDEKTAYRVKQQPPSSSVSRSELLPKDAEAESVPDVSPKVGRRVSEIFNTLRKKGVDATAGRRAFAFGKRSKSIETTETGKSIGAMASQVMAPAIDPVELSDSAQGSQAGIGDEGPFRLRKSSSASKFIDRFRKKKLLKQGSGSIDSEDLDLTSSTIASSNSNLLKSTASSSQGGSAKMSSAENLALPPSGFVESRSVYRLLRHTSSSASNKLPK